MKIYVNDNPNTGACNVADHFERNWNKETLHPDVAEIIYTVNRTAYVDSIVVEDNDFQIAFILTDGEALRLDELQEKILELL